MNATQRRISRCKDFIRADESDDRVWEFAARLTFERKRRKMTQIDFAALLGVSQPQLSNLENGLLEPVAMTVFDLERKLGLVAGSLSACLGYVPAVKA